MRRIRFLFFTGMFSLFLPRLNAQEMLNLCGQILDDESRLPLAFAAVSLTHSTLGTITNEDGKFQLNIPPRYCNDSLLIAYLGYQTLKTPVHHITGCSTLFRLKPKAIQLSEVEILGLTPGEVIRRAVQRIPENYGRDSLVLTTYIRVQKTANNKLAEYAEAIVENLKDGYYSYPRSEMKEKFKRSNLPHLFKGRVISDTSLVNSLEDIGKEATCLSCNFKEDMVEFYHQGILDEKEFKNYDFRMLEQSHPEDGKLYRITFDQKDHANISGWKGELLIQAATYAILRIIMKPSIKAFNHYEKTKFKHTFSILGTQGWIKEMPMGETIVTYAKKGGQWCLSSIHNDYWMVYSLPSTGARFKARYKNDVVVTEVSRDPEIIRNFKGDKSLGIGQRWDQISGKPDPEFWAGFNYLPIEEKLQQELSTLNH